MARCFAFLSGSLACSLAGLPAVAQEQLWIRQFGTAAHDWALALATDGAGGVLVAGSTEGELGTASAGDYDGWISRYDSAGSRLWIRQIGSSGWDAVRALESDGAGGAFAAGETWGDLGGPYMGSNDAWLGRVDGAGNQVWLRQLGTSAGDWAYALATDDAGGAFVAGSTFGSLAGAGAGGGDVWLARYDGAGNQLWILQFGTSADDRGYCLAPDGAGGAYFAGNTRGNLGGAMVGNGDAWLARYDNAGNRHWIRQFGSSAYEMAFALAPDGEGGAFIAGFTLGSLGAPSAGHYDVWVARYDSGGNQLWIRQFGTSEEDRAFALAYDGAGGAFIGGLTGGSLATGSSGDRDAWMGRYDSAGNQVWLRQFGTPAEDWIGALASDSAGGMFATGITSGSLGGSHGGGDDAWLARWSGGASPCYANCDNSTAHPALNVDDFTCFIDAFAAAQALPHEQQVNHYANCDNSTAAPALNVDDFTCFINEFAQGCP